MASPHQNRVASHLHRYFIEIEKKYAIEFPEVYETRVARIAQWKGQKEQLEKDNGNLLCSEEEVRSRFGG